MKTPKLLIILLIVICSSCKEEKVIEPVKPTATVLIGEVIGRPDSKMLWMTKHYEDFRTDSVVKIPIVDRKFSYSFKADAIESYVLAFKEEVERGSYRTVTIFSENDTLRIKLHNNEDYNDNIISGGKINKIYQNLINEERKLFYSDYDSINKKYEKYNYKEFYSEEYVSLINQLGDTKTKAEEMLIYKKQNELKKQDLHRNELGKIREKEYKAIRDKHTEYKYNYISKNNTIVAYDMLVMDMVNRKKEIELGKIVKNFNRFKNKYPKHPYTALGQNLISAINSLKPGGKYVNFTAPDVNGKQFELKSILEEHEIVLLDLWATWCGPCIVHTRQAKPVYEKYKDKGFTILGVAGEHDDLKSYHKFMEKEQWPWQQLIELDKENRIWEKYSIMNSGGGMFLIDKTGEMLAVNPTVEELETILETKLIAVH